MKSIFLTLVILGGFMIWSPNLFAQLQDEDCIIYKKVLKYFNSEFSKVKYTGVKGVTDPTDPHQDSVLNTINYRYSFFVVNLRDRFSNAGVQYWFSNIVRDSALMQYTYVSSNDSLINCNFPPSIEYQYKNFEEIEFEKSDHFIKVAGEDTFHYVPIRMFFSNILYANSIALVRVRVYEGLGSGRDNAIYVFVYRKEGEVWVLEKVTKATS